MKQKEKAHAAPASEEKKTAMRVSSVSIAVNLILSLMKLAAGIIAKSGAMVSDAVHSASDVFSTFIVMIGVAIAGKPSDNEHPYGHERIECIASIVLAVVLGITGAGIGLAGVKKIIAGSYGGLGIPGLPALIAAIVSIITKEWMFWYTRANAKKINSGALMADAWHHRSDALSSVGAFAGILGARMGFPVLDPIASIVICIFIEKAAFDILRDAMSKMVDRACDEKTVEDMKKLILSDGNIASIDELKTRLFGSKIYVEIEISVDSAKSFPEAHEIAEAVHEKIETGFPAVKHCMVHVNPLITEK